MKNPEKSVFEAKKRLGKIADDIAGHEALLAQIFGRQIARKTMEMHAQTAGIGAVVAPGQQAGDDARQHVAAASRGHAAVARARKLNFAVGVAEGRIVAL